MKINSKLMLIGVAMASSPIMASANVSKAEATERQFHKLNTLVMANKIDSGFLDHLAGLTVTAEGETLLVHFNQEANPGITPASVTIKTDWNGRGLTYNVIPGSEISNPVNWAGKVPADILEKAMEYLADTVSDNRLNAFRDHLSAASIAAEHNGALVLIQGAQGDGTIRMHLDMAGNVLSVEVK